MCPITSCRFFALLSAFALALALSACGETTTTAEGTEGTAAEGGEGAEVTEGTEAESEGAEDEGAEEGEEDDEGTEGGTGEGGEGGETPDGGEGAEGSEVPPFEGTEGVIEGIEGAAEGVEGAGEGTEGAVEGTEGMIEGSEGVVEGTEGMIEGAEGAVEGTEGMIEGAEGVVEGTEGMIEGVEGATEGTEGGQGTCGAVEAAPAVWPPATDWWDISDIENPKCNLPQGVCVDNATMCFDTSGTWQQKLETIDTDCPKLVAATDDRAAVGAITYEEPAPLGWKGNCDYDAASGTLAAVTFGNDMISCEVAAEQMGVFSVQTSKLTWAPGAGTGEATVYIVNLPGIAGDPDKQCYLKFKVTYTKCDNACEPAGTTAP